MQLTRRGALAGAAALTAAPTLRARAQAKPSVKVGVLTDLSGTYRDTTGPNSVTCTRQAITEFDAPSKGFNVELVQADHQNKPNVAVSIARQWFDQGVDAIVDVPTSSVALAVSQVAKEKDKILLDGSATTTDLTDSQCTPNTIVWSFDTYMLAQSNGGATVRAGGKSWYFVTADYVFGHVLEEQTAAVVKQAGGTVKGKVRYPFPDTTDFSSYLQQAQASGAQVLGLANAGADTINSIKQAHEFGLNQSMRIAPLLIFITDIHALGPDLAAGLNATTSFYWDFNDRTRAFTKRVLPKMDGKYPNQAHASNYAITLHYLKTVAAMGAANAKKSGRDTVARMKGIPTDDDAFGQGRIRADGRGEFPAYLWQVKKPAKPGGWDLFSLVTTTPPDKALHPLNPKCSFPVVSA
ncbi:MAG: ABC transporter substrate-binding protein [Acetobacteraceae bacterium]|nr:ABC transporter substrate-binding protein [Acetobacteraceae bacterium]MBV9118019.1 ABC transporter substrate-binding protein [Acetobacteraceae bacterium]MBV9778150.1 ABC transporter substrate-binding protein [Acetobacteraceae bacterium]